MILSIVAMTGVVTLTILFAKHIDAHVNRLAAVENEIRERILFYEIRLAHATDEKEIEILERGIEKLKGTTKKKRGRTK